MDMGTITEPESLGPCEPGTAVTLEGIVWHENDQGNLKKMELFILTLFDPEMVFAVF